MPIKPSANAQTSIQGFVEALTPKVNALDINYSDDDGRMVGLNIASAVLLQYQNTPKKVRGTPIAKLAEHFGQVLQRADVAQRREDGAGVARRASSFWYQIQTLMPADMNNPRLTDSQLWAMEQHEICTSR